MIARDRAPKRERMTELVKRVPAHHDTYEVRADIERDTSALINRTRLHLCYPWSCGVTRVRGASVTYAGTLDEREHAGEDGNRSRNELNSLENHDVLEHLQLVSPIHESQTNEEHKRLETETKVEL